MPPFSSHAFDWRKFSKMEVQYERIITKAYSLKVIDYVCIQATVMWLLNSKSKMENVIGWFSSQRIILSKQLYYIKKNILLSDFKQSVLFFQV